MSSVIREPGPTLPAARPDNHPLILLTGRPAARKRGGLCPKPRMMAFDVRESRGLVDMTFSGLLGPVRRRSRRTHQAARPEPDRHGPDCPSWQLRTG